MILLCLLLFCLFHNLLGTEERSYAKITITPVPKIKGVNAIYKRVEETLNLTCILTSLQNEKLPKFEMAWYLPSTPTNSKHRAIREYGYNILNLVVQNLQESDSGVYHCEAKGDEIQLKENVTVHVKGRKTYCGDNMFFCPSKICIHRRFLCDGRRDCKDGADEGEYYCRGKDPCEGKLRCDDGRCIPHDVCCDHLLDPGCLVKIKPTCCQQLYKTMKATAGENYPGFHPQQQYNEVGFLQTTIYTVIGCVMAFMFIVTILGIAICRVHMKRTVISRYPRGHFGHHQQRPFYDIDVYVNRPCSEGGSDLSHSYPSTSVPASGFLVTYNINNGVQFVGHPVDPPPYSEIVRTPPREGPPPPYASRENIGRAEENEENETRDVLLGSESENGNELL